MGFWMKLAHVFLFTDFWQLMYSAQFKSNKFSLISGACTSKVQIFTQAQRLKWERHYLKKALTEAVRMFLLRGYSQPYPPLPIPFHFPSLWFFGFPLSIFYAHWAYSILIGLQILLQILAPFPLRLLLSPLCACRGVFWLHSTVAQKTEGRSMPYIQNTWLPPESPGNCSFPLTELLFTASQNYNSQNFLVETICYKWASNVLSTHGADLPWVCC